MRELFWREPCTLLLPWSQTKGEVGFVDALFTSTSAVCVTGLVVVDTGTAYTLFGQTVIVALIQIGGLGIMTFAAMAYLMLGRRLSLASQAALHDAFFQRDLGIEFKRKFFQILLITASIELAGIFCIFLALLWRQAPALPALFSAFFHSISAFCNAGFSIYKDNLIGLRDSPVIMTTIMSLIVLGGLGHMVIFEVWHHGKNWFFRSNPSGPHPISTHSRVVLRMTLALIIIGWLGIAHPGPDRGGDYLGDETIFGLVSIRHRPHRRFQHGGYRDHAVGLFAAHHPAHVHRRLPRFLRRRGQDHRAGHFPGASSRLN